MIRSYTIGEMEELTGTNRRTISDYITKGLLTGPSHRGRGAVYSQRDLNVLQLIPRLRTLMKDEFSTLKSVAGFLSQLGSHDIQTLVQRRSERGFVVEVRRLRVRLALMAMMPYVPPEKFDVVLEQLTPEQICAVDAGRTQIGAVIDMARLFETESAEAAFDGVRPAAANGNGAATSELVAEVVGEQVADVLATTDTLPRPDLSLAEAEHGEAALQTDDTRTLLAMKLDEIANRLDRVERMLDSETD